MTEPVGPAVVDAHTHVFAPEVIADRERFAGYDLWFEHLYANPKALLTTADDLLASMDEAGVAQAVLCGFPWHDLAICRDHNDYMHAATRAAPDRLAWLGIVPGGGGDAAAAEAERCFALGASGIGELNADAQRFDLTDQPSLAPLMAVCAATERPVMLHATEPVGHEYPGKGTATPDRLLRFIQNFPGQPIVLAHWGGGLPFYELMPEVAAATTHVRYDTAASTYLYRHQVFRAVVDIIGPERVLFGSDYPVLGMGRFLRRVRERGGLREDELWPILGANARRVYRLGPAGAAAEVRGATGQP